MLKEILTVVDNGTKQGKFCTTAERACACPRDKWNGGFLKAATSLDTLYNDRTGKKGEFIKHNQVGSEPDLQSGDV